MNRYLIVDDDNTRGLKIKKLLISNHRIPEEFIDYAECVNEATAFLRRTFYTIIFVDVALPQLKRGEINPTAGLNIVQSIINNRLKRPGTIFAYTGIEDEIENHKQKYYKETGFELVYCPANDFSWLENRKAIIDYNAALFNGLENKNSDIVILTLHGIRTYGKWQDKLAEICKNSEGFSSVKNLPFKYTLISTLSFLMPSRRKLVVNDFKKVLSEYLENNRSRRIICIGHSFGSYVLMHALKELEDRSLLKELDLIVLCGSVLDRNFNFDFLDFNDNLVIINECAVHDFPLAINEAFVPDVGLAGVTGFNGFSGKNFFNRYHTGGHSCFFAGDFMEKHWLPILLNPEKMIHINDGDSQSYFYKLFALKFCVFIGMFKRKIYSLFSKIQ
ncbi:alpha/beta hydrolase [Metakosakonia massiliensis]|uniref:Response regulatory domain-containing protein n=1 Tax=Phytobacter massiliensis TaxID=1485952 RepID=A0A6N3E1H3_9ENTR